VTQPTVAGVAVVVRSLVEDQAAAGYDVAVAAPAEGDVPGWMRDLGVPHLQWQASRQPGPTVPDEVRRLRRIVRQFAPDIVHLHSAKAGLAGRLALRGAVPTVYQPHAWSFEAAGGVVGAAARWWERRAARWTDLLVCVSEDERRRGEAAGVRTCAVVVVPNGVDLGRFQEASAADRIAARRSLGLPDRPTVVCVGRLAPQKGQDVLLAALPAVTARVPDVHLVLVGDGPDADRLRAAAPDGVLFAGGRSDVWPWLAAADVVVLPSRWEAGPLVMLEGMAVGRSVVSTAVGDASEALAGVGGVVPVDDADALADALAARLEDPALAEREGRAARARVESLYDVATASRRLREAYSLLLPASGQWAP
jgi:glycosyltransferase involved in cell wall biosynthesis